MIWVQAVVVPKIGRPQDNFFSWLAPRRAILNVKRVWLVVPVGDAASSFSSNQVCESDPESDIGSDRQHATYVACMILLWGLGKVPFVSVIQVSGGAKCESFCMSSTVR